MTPEVEFWGTPFFFYEILFFRPSLNCSRQRQPKRPQNPPGLASIAAAVLWRRYLNSAQFAHVTLLRPALSFLSGRCGRASQHKVFRNTTSCSDWPLFNTLFTATNTEFLLSLGTPCRDLSQSTAQHKLCTTTPTSAGHIATVPPHCSASATTLGATHGPVGS